MSPQMCAVIPHDDPSPIAYINVFEAGDMWIKTRGCADCPKASKAQCCRKCPVFTGGGCMFHESNNHSTNKPYQCVVKPLPNQGHSYCHLEYTCIKGKHKGKIRRLNETLDEING